MGIPFVDLKSQYSLLADDINAAIKKVLDHGQYINGPEVVQLEQELAKYVGVDHVVGCSSGTDALLMALMACEVGPGDLVFTTPYTFVATAEVVTLLGAIPVFVDIDKRTFNIDPEKLDAAIKKALSEKKGQPKAVIPVDLFGLPADYESINMIAIENGMVVIEDAAQSFGAEYHGRKACGLGHVGATSFFPAKPLGCYGDGGAVFTDDDKVAEKLRSIRVHGMGADKYSNVRIGLNARLDTMQAAILLPKLAQFPKEIEVRQQVAKQYSSALEGHVEVPFMPEGVMSAWAQYSVLSEKRTEIRDALQQQEIPTAIYYPKPLHLQDAYLDLGYKAGDFPVSENISQRIFSLPMHPYLMAEQVDAIATIISTAVSGG